MFIIHNVYENMDINENNSTLLQQTLFYYTYAGMSKTLLEYDPFSLDLVFI